MFFDDSRYDYMQHLRDVGRADQGMSTWVEAPTQRDKSKGKGKVPLDEALRDMALASERAPSPTRSLAAPSSTASAVPRPQHETQQDVPDALAGLQPDMDPRLREVLAALDDEAYIDQGPAEEDAGREGMEGMGEGGDAFFATIARGGQEVSLDEFEAMGAMDEGDESWASDDTARPARRDGDARHARDLDLDLDLALPEVGPDARPSADTTAEAAMDHGDGAFMASFHDPSTRPAPPTTAPPPFRPPNQTTTPAAANGDKPPPPHSVASLLTSAPSSALLAASGAGAFRPGKKRRGAQTASDAHSMTSGSLARTEGMETLDARFERVLRSYEEDIEGDEGDDEMGSMVSGMTGASRGSARSKASGVSGASRGSWAGRSAASGAGKGKAPARADGLEDALDEFLAGAGGKFRSGRWGGSVAEKAARKERGVRELDAIRTELGPARV